MGATRQDAKFGAPAFEGGGGALPGVFPREMGPNAMRYLQEVVDSGLGSDLVARMERAIADAHGVRFCVGAPGCSQALFTGMMAMDFEPGDEVVFSPIADYGTVAGALFHDLVPVFADTEPGTGLVSAETLEPHIGGRTRAVVVVHLLGLPCDMPPLVQLAKKHGLVLVEDVCQAILSTCGGRLAGTFGDLACFSFDSEKTCGADMGGATITDDEGIHRRLSNCGPARGAVQEPGFGRVHLHRGFPTRIPQCSAATVLANFEILPRQIAQRQRTAALFDSLIADIPGVVPYRVPEGRTHTYWMHGFTVEPERFSCAPAEFAGKLQEAGLKQAGLAPYYLMPEAIRFLPEWARAGRHPFSIPPASRIPEYSADAVPNARDFLKTWVRWFWTEKYTEGHVQAIAGIVRQTVSENLK